MIFLFSFLSGYFYIRSDHLKKLAPIVESEHQTLLKWTSNNENIIYYILSTYKNNIEKK